MSRQYLAEKEDRWSVELWNISGGGSDTFKTKAEALKKYRKLKQKVKRDYSEYEWIEEKSGSELIFRCTDEYAGMSLQLGDLHLL